MIRVRDRRGERIAEDRRRILERNSVALEVAGGLLRVPLELHPTIVMPPSALPGPFSVGRTPRSPASTHRLRRARQVLLFDGSSLSDVHSLDSTTQPSHKPHNAHRDGAVQHAAENRTEKRGDEPRLRKLLDEEHHGCKPEENPERL